MKKAYLILTIFLMMGIWSCKTKKITTDLKQIETEQTSYLITESNNQRSLITETEQKIETKTEIDKSILEEWMSIKSDVAIFEDNKGNKWTFTNPEIAKNQKQSNDFKKNEHSIIETIKTSQTEENSDTDIVVNENTESTTDYSEDKSSKPKEPILLYVISACALGGLVFLILRNFKLL